MNIERLQRDLLTLQVDDCEEIYERLLECLLEVTGASVGVFFRGTRSGERVFYDSLRVRGDLSDPEGEIADRCNGREVLAGKTMTILKPALSEISSFVEIETDDDLRDAEIGETFLRPFGIRDWARLHVYSGPRFMGHLGAYYREGDRRGDAVTMAHLTRLSRVFSVAMSTAEVLRGDAIDGAGAHFILKPCGEVDFASAHGAELLTEDRRAGLRQAVRELDAGEVESCVKSLGGLEARVTRVEGRGMFRYLAQLSPATVCEVDPLSLLTSTQRRVAEYAACGATAKEIGAAMGRSLHTVKAHLRSIYERLEIGSRAELAAIVESSRP